MIADISQVTRYRQAAAASIISVRLPLSYREQATSPDAEWHIDTYLHTQTSSQNKGRRYRNNSVTVPRTCVVTSTYREKTNYHPLQ